MENLLLLEAIYEQFMAPRSHIWTSYCTQKLYLDIKTSEHLLENHDFQYILPAVFSQDPVEKFFGYARQRCGGSFYIDIVDVLAVAKIQQMHQVVKYGIIPETHEVQNNECTACTQVILSEHRRLE